MHGQTEMFMIPFLILGLIILAPITILFVLWVMKPVLRSIAQYEREIGDPTGDQPKSGVGGILLFFGVTVAVVLTLVIVYNVAKEEHGVANPYEEANMEVLRDESPSLRVSELVPPVDTPPQVEQLSQPLPPSEILPQPPSYVDGDNDQKAITSTTSDSGVLGTSMIVDLSKNKETKEPEDSKPEWLTRKPGMNHTVLASDPFQDYSECSRNIDHQTVAWLQKRLNLEPSVLTMVDELSQELRTRFVRAEYSEERKTSVGDMRVVWRLVELNPDDATWLKDRVYSYQAGGRVRLVATIGGVVLALLATIYAVLGVGQNPAEKSA